MSFDFQTGFERSFPQNSSYSWAYTYGQKKFTNNSIDINRKAFFHRKLWICDINLKAKVTEITILFIFV